MFFSFEKIAKCVLGLGLFLSSSTVVNGEELTEGKCMALVENEEGKMESIALGKPSFLELAKHEKFELDVPDNYKAFGCWRSSIVPAENDYKFIMQGFPFNIYSKNNEGEDQILVLEISDGQFRVRILTGKISDQEGKSIQKRLNEFQDVYQAEKN